MPIEQIIGITAGVLTSISMLPQLIKLVKEKKPEALSPVMLVILISGLILWAIYGILKNDWPIILTNGFSIVLNITLLVLRQVYKERKK